MIVFAIVVSYNPNVRHLAELCEVLNNEQARVLVIDNSESEDIVDLPQNLCTVLRLGSNTGIAHAQNVGIRAALAANADAVVLFDQDSLPKVGFLEQLLRELDPGKPGVVAPLCIDRVSGKELPSFDVSRYGWVHKIVSAGRVAPYCTDLVIASGCAVSANTFAVVGLMDEAFFIDFVDFEWCFRCRSKRVPIRVVPGAILEHSIGEQVVDRRWRRGSVHSATRTYYKTRNCFILFRKKHVPKLFAVRAIALATIHFTILLPFVRNRRSYLKMVGLGFCHGLSGVVGRKPVMPEDHANAGH